MHPLLRLSLLVLPAASCRGAGDHDTEPATSGSSTGVATTVVSSTSLSSTAGSTTAPADGPGITTSADEGCGPGLACVDASRVPPGLACEGSDGCCTELCELIDPTGDLQCTGAAVGEQCLPYYSNGVAPEGYESLGVPATSVTLGGRIMKRRTSNHVLLRALGCGCALLGAAACRGASADHEPGESGNTATSELVTDTSNPWPPAEDDDDTGSDVGEDLYQGLYPCNVLSQDCPVGEKCMPWANDGGGTFNAAKCVPIVEDPAAEGEPCHVEGSGTSGIDDCELGTMCWDVDPKTNEGICVSMCIGPEENPFCDDPETQCAINSSEVLLLCVPVCDPIEQDCPAGQACYAIRGTLWACGSDASGDMGGYGDPCEYVSGCAPGLLCLDASTVPVGQACEGAPGCCTEICDLSDPAGDLQCAGAAGGQLCQPWYEAGTAPAGYENVGACALPA